jgi:hypothetical protein
VTIEGGEREIAIRRIYQPDGLIDEHEVILNLSNAH